MFSEAGEYAFVPGKVNGGAIEGIVAVDWLWATKPQSGDTQDILTDLSYSDGKVYFTATGNKGNIVLAATDAEGTIVWSWLIWATDQPATMVFENGAEFMDRNIGATSAEEDSNDAFGLMYQWGRKEAFYGGTLNEDSVDAIPFSTAEVETVVNDAFGMTWQYANTVATLEMGTAQPMTMFYDGAETSGSGNWIDNHENAVWANEKTDSDPCPAGYRVPSSDEYSGIENGEIDAKGLTYTYNGQSAWFPVQGLREDRSGILVLYNWFWLWTNSELTRESLFDPNILFYLALRAGGTEESGTGPLISNAHQSNRAMAMPVRCVKE